MTPVALATPAPVAASSDRPASDLRLEAPRHVTDDDLSRFEGYAAEILTAFGMDLSNPGTAETPRRFVQALTTRPTATTATRSS